MEDALGKEIHEGDLILEIDPSYNWSVFGVVFGGITDSGRIRYLVPNLGNRKKPTKRNAKSANVLKVDKDFILESKRSTMRGLIPETFKTELFIIQDTIKVDK